jgi:excisionase family DNA binding protein
MTTQTERNTGATLEQRLLKAEEVARRLAIGKATAYMLMASGELPTVRIGKSVRVSERILNSWIEERTGAAVLSGNRRLISG